jgi:hypothetical protein
MTKTQEIKLMIINNFIDAYTTNELERTKCKKLSYIYVKEDHVDEIAQSFHIHEDSLGVHTTCQNCDSSTNL